MTKDDKALTALRATKGRLSEVAAYSGLSVEQVKNLAKAHGIKLEGRL